MKVSAFTFLRNAEILAYPFEASIRSILPLVDEFIVNVGQSEDDTLARIRAMNEPKIRIIESIWNPDMRDRGYVYAQQKMIAQFNCTGDWAFYLEGDEIVHEDDLPAIRQAMQQHLHNPRVEALAFRYHHFYGTPDLVAQSPGWYRYAPRIIRNTIRCICPDSLYFVVLDKNKRGRYPRAVELDARIFHYGWVRSAAAMQRKIKQVTGMWNKNDSFSGYQKIDASILKPYTGTHPAVVQQWLKEDAEHVFTPDPNYRLSRRDKRHHLLMWLERLCGRYLTKKHYSVVK